MSNVQTEDICSDTPSAPVSHAKKAEKTPATPSNYSTSKEPQKLAWSLMHCFTLELKVDVSKY